MNQTHILNEQLLFKAKQYIADVLVKASTDRYYHNGVDTNQLIKIYNELDINNVNTLYKNAKNIVSLHLNMKHRNLTMMWLKSSMFAIASVGIGYGIGYLSGKLFNYKINTGYVIMFSILIFSFCI